MPETVYEPETFLARVYVGVVVACILPAAQFNEHLCDECNDENSYYYNPNSHRIWLLIG